MKIEKHRPSLLTRLLFGRVGMIHHHMPELTSPAEFFTNTHSPHTNRWFPKVIETAPSCVTLGTDISYGYWVNSSDLLVGFRFKWQASLHFLVNNSSKTMIIRYKIRRFKNRFTSKQGDLNSLEKDKVQSRTTFTKGED